MTLAHTDEGDGPAVVLLHGWSLERTMWQPQVAGLAGHGFRAIAPDLPGHGGSAGPENDRSFSAAAPAVLELLDALGVRRAVVCGLSMGAAVALEMALAAPERVAGLLLADNAAASGAARGTAAAARLRAATADELVAHYAPLLFSAGFRRDRPDAVGAWARQFRANDLGVLAETVESYHSRRDVRPLLAGLAVPTTVVFGTEDATTPEDRRRDYEAIPGAVRDDLPDAGHLSNLEQPEAFLARLLRLAGRAAVRP